MSSFWTRQRIAAAQMPVTYPAQELRWLLSYSVFYVALSGITAQLILHWPMPLLNSRDFLLSWWYFLGFKILFLLVIPAATWWRLGYRWSDLAPTGLDARDFLWSVIGFCVGISLSFSSYFPAMKVRLLSGQLPDPWLRLASGAAIALFNAAIPEEFVYRYLLQSRLELRFGRILAILGTAVLFTAWHIPSRYFLAFGSEGNAGNLNSVVVNTGVPVFCVALVLGLCWDRSRRLLPLIALHWGIDFLPLVAPLFGVIR